ncbi:MAG: response regulator, partial [Deltaproteobacteria bacterium]|nr:response regulator [Deltaproteobacteria bacterium]
MTSIRALVVDDSKVMRDLVRSCLESLGAEVTVADSAEAGLWTFQTLDPDLVVSDIRMAAMTGIELSRRIKEQSRGRVHVLLISSTDQGEGRDAVARGDADAFLAKPVDWKALEETVERLLGDRRHGATPAIARVRAKIGVVVADDTEVGRRLIARALDVDPDFEIVEAVA